MNLDIAKPIVDRAASKLGRDWPGIDPDDIAQEMWIAVHSQWDTIESEPREDWEKLIAYRANRAGTHYCQTERYAYQHYTTEWVYTPKEIRQLFANNFFGRDADPQAPKRPEWGNQTLLGDGACIALMDMESAFEALSEPDQAVLIRAYDVRETLGDVERKRLTRAIDKVAAALNRNVSQKFNHSDHDGPGSRTVVSNSQAQAVTHNDYY